MTEKITFDQLPEAVMMLTKEVGELKKMLLTLNEQQLTGQPEQLLTVQQAAEFLSLATSTIYGKVSRNKLPYMKRGKRLYFSSTELLDYLKAGRKKTFDEIRKEASNYLKAKK